MSHSNEYPGKIFVPHEGGMPVNTVQMPDIASSDREGIATVDQAAETSSLRAMIDECLAGMAAVRDGTVKVYFIQLNILGEGVMITPDNVDEQEQGLRSAFAAYYPDLIEKGDTE